MAARVSVAILIALLLLLVNSALADEASDNSDVRAPFEESINRNRSRLPQLQAPNSCQSDIGTSNLELVEILFSNGERKSIIPFGLEITQRLADGQQEGLLFFMERRGAKWVTGIQRLNLEDKARMNNPYGIIWHTAGKSKTAKIQIRSIDIHGTANGPSACTLTELVKDSDHNIVRVLARSRPDEVILGDLRAPASTADVEGSQ